MVVHGISACGVHAGKEIFVQALQGGHMNGFFKLIQQFSTQTEPAFCGIASLTVVMNALEVDPRRIWKGSWRWFAEDMLDCCKPLEAIKEEGVTLDQVACLASCNGVNALLHRSGTFTEEQFRADILECTSAAVEHLVVSYGRKAFLQTGDGHFSPVGGYCPERDLVLILDTARFKYPPHWVPLTMLFDAMKAIDATTGQPRGYIRVSASEDRFTLAFTMSIQGGWHAAYEYASQGVVDTVQRSLQSQPSTGQELLATMIQEAPVESLMEMLQPRSFNSHCNQQLISSQRQLLHELRHLPVFTAARNLLGQDAGAHVLAQADHAVTTGACPLDYPPVLGSGDSEECEKAHTLVAETLAVYLLLCSDTLQSCQQQLLGDQASPEHDRKAAAFQELLGLLTPQTSTMVQAEVGVLRAQLSKLPVLDGDGGDNIGERVTVCSGCSQTPGGCGRPIVA